MTGDALEDATWPVVDNAALVKSTVEMVVQVNGKLRGKFEVGVEATKDEIETLAREEENVARFIEDKTVRKVIVVPQKLVNFVVA